MSSKKIVIKFKYENESDIWKMPLNENGSTKSFQTQQSDYFSKQKNKTQEILFLYHLYNPVTRMYVQDFKEIYDDSIVFQMKNCKSHAIEIAQKLIEAIKINQSLNVSISSSMPHIVDLKKIMLELSYFLKIGTFAEEFIQEDGIALLLKILELTSGNTQTKALEAFAALTEYQNAIQYIEDNIEIFEQFFKILIRGSQEKGNVKLVSAMLMLYTSIIGIIKEKGCDKFIQVVQSYANENSTKPYQEIITFVSDVSIDIKENAILLLCAIVKYTKNKNSKMKIVTDLLEAGLSTAFVDYMQCKSPKFRDYVLMFFSLAKQCGMPINLEIEKYKQTIEKLEENCLLLQNENAEIKKKQKFYDEIVDEFIYFKNLADVCTMSGGYYFPCKNAIMLID